MPCYRARLLWPRYELNWLKSDIWAKQTWTYSANFSIDQLGLESTSAHRVQLVFDGIKMGAHVKVAWDAGKETCRRCMEPQTIEYKLLVSRVGLVETVCWIWSPWSGLNSFKKGSRSLNLKRRMLLTPISFILFLRSLWSCHLYLVAWGFRGSLTEWIAHHMILQDIVSLDGCQTFYILMLYGTVMLW